MTGAKGKLMKTLYLDKGVEIIVNGTRYSWGGCSKVLLKQLSPGHWYIYDVLPEEYLPDSKLRKTKEWIEANREELDRGVNDDA